MDFFTSKFLFFKNIVYICEVKEVDCFTLEYSIVFYE